ncbi:hypothetical protein ScPMuIL_008376 [Solemya velum]
MKTVIRNILLLVLTASLLCTLAESKCGCTEAWTACFKLLKKHMALKYKHKYNKQCRNIFQNCTRRCNEDKDRKYGRLGKDYKPITN